jgi:hypothetical protein
MAINNWLSDDKKEDNNVYIVVPKKEENNNYNKLNNGRYSEQFRKYNNQTGTITEKAKKKLEELEEENEYKKPIRSRVTSIVGFLIVLAIGINILPNLFKLIQESNIISTTNNSTNLNATLSTTLGNFPIIFFALPIIMVIWSLTNAYSR